MGSSGGTNAAASAFFYCWGFPSLLAAYLYLLLLW